MTTITPEVAEKLAESWALYPDYRARFDALLCEYLDQFEDADERRAACVYLVEIAAYFTSADELAREWSAKLHAAEATKA